MTAITVKYTSRLDGLGQRVKGWYIIRFDIPIGCAYPTKEVALKAIGLYLADCYRMVSVNG